MKPAYRIIALATLVVLTACGGSYDRNPAAGFNGPQMVGSPFSRYMAQAYRDLSHSMQTGLFSGIFGSADAKRHFARKSRASADGVIVMPEMPGDWNPAGADFAEIAQARAYLVETLDKGGRDFAPDKAAFAQSRFDCWAAGQERMGDDASSCEQQFKKVLRILRSSLNAGSAPAVAAVAGGTDTATTDTSAPLPSAPVADEFLPPIATPAPGPGPVDKGALAAVRQAMFIVFFDWDKTSLSGSANDVMDAIAEELKTRQDVKKIVVVGHADTSGGAQYNKKLSLKRANAVREALIARGAPGDKISAEGRGEGDLLVRTPDNVREPGNRRAQITLE